MIRVLLLLLWTAPLMAADGKIHKVLPHLIDKEGRHSLSPSLYERDAYQAVLRAEPARRGGLRFHVHWKARKSTALKLRIDGRGSKNDQTSNFSIEQPVKPPGLFSKWSALTLHGKDYEAVGDLRSWRATLWDGEQMLAEQKSFLW